MKKIPRLLAEKVLEMQSDVLYESLRKKLCNTACSQDADGMGIDCPECIVEGGNTVAKAEFREYLVEHGINLSVVRSI